MHQKFSLDLFLGQVSSWERLQRADIPIFIYGMGDGCVKLIRLFEKFGIAYSGIFASDEFVRGHSFMGHKVRTLTEIESQVDDFIIVLAFAAGYEKLIKKIDALEKKHEIIAPDMPVVGDVLFDKTFLSDNFEKFSFTYNMLCDEYSRIVFTNIILFKITGKLRFLREIHSGIDEVYTTIINPKNDEVYVDLGAYNGDTISEFLGYTNGVYSHIYGLEPNVKNYKRLVKKHGELRNCTLINAAAYSEDTTLIFSKDSGRQSKISETGIETSARSVDSVVGVDKVSFIKYDVEGAEHSAIDGSKMTIQKNSPTLLVALYHRTEDLFDLPMQIQSINNEYDYYLRQFPYYPAWELNLICIRKTENL